MRTSLIEIQKIEGFILGTLPAEEAILLESKMILDIEFKRNVEIQQAVMNVVQTYGKNQSSVKLKKEIQQVEQKVFSNRKYKSWKNRIFQFFK